MTESTYTHVDLAVKKAQEVQLSARSIWYVKLQVMPTIDVKVSVGRATP